MKKLSAYIFLLLFLLSVVGGQYLLFHTYRIHVRQQAKQTLREMAFDEAEVLGFSNEELKHKLPFVRVADKEDEIIFNGEYFDVKAATFSGDSVFLYAYRDTREKMLMAQYEKMTRQNDHSPAARMLQNFTNLFVFIPVHHTPPSMMASLIRIMMGEVSNHYCQSIISIDIPPPRLA